MASPLDGIRILEFGQYQQAPAAAALLGDLGAEVIKIEEPGKGDLGRTLERSGGMSTIINGWNVYFESFNRNKKSITLNFRTSEAKEILYKLVKKSDVFITNSRVGVPKKLGLGYEDLVKHNPRLIYVHSSGLGRKGPDSTIPSLDYMFQARSALMANIAEDGTVPIVGPIGTADQIGSMASAFAVIAGLLVRERTGIGQEINVSALGASIWAQQQPIEVALLSKQLITKPSRKQAENPIWNHYRCRDGRWVAFAMAQGDRFWPDFCKAIGHEELITDERFSTSTKRAENKAVIIKQLDDIFITKDLDDWLDAFRKGGELMYSPVNTIQDLPSDPQVVENKYIVDYDHPSQGKIKVVNAPFDFSKNDVGPRSPAPELGQNTEEVLMELLGYSWEDVAKFKDLNAI